MGHLLGEPKREHKNISLFKNVIIVNTIIFTFPVNHPLITHSNFQQRIIQIFIKSLDVFTSLFVHTFKTSNLMNDELNCNVQSCFEVFVDKYHETLFFVNHVTTVTFQNDRDPFRRYIN